jgi:hypothetical protein
MLNEATVSDYCEWLFKNEATELLNTDGTLNDLGKRMVELLKTNPNKVLSAIKIDSKRRPISFVLETKKTLIILDNDKFCKEVLEGYKKHYLSFSASHSSRIVSISYLRKMLKFLGSIFVPKFAKS